jgi:hypothetical protein
VRTENFSRIVLVTPWRCSKIRPQKGIVFGYSTKCPCSAQVKRLFFEGLKRAVLAVRKQIDEEGCAKANRKKRTSLLPFADRPGMEQDTEEVRLYDKLISLSKIFIHCL